LFAFLSIIEGTTEKVLQFIIPLKSIYNRNFDFIEQKIYFLNTKDSFSQTNSINCHYFRHGKKFCWPFQRCPLYAYISTTQRCAVPLKQFLWFRNDKFAVFLFILNPQIFPEWKSPPQKFSLIFYQFCLVSEHKVRVWIPRMQFLDCGPKHLYFHHTVASQANVTQWKRRRSQRGIERERKRERERERDRERICEKEWERESSAFRTGFSRERDGTFFLVCPCANVSFWVFVSATIRFETESEVKMFGFGIFFVNLADWVSLENYIFISKFVC